MGTTESFEFLNELALAFRAAENHPRPQCAPVLEGVRAVLTHLHSAGRLIPAGGRALTAERVENVRAAREELRGYRNFTGYGRSYVNQLIAAVDALFPATEPAEEVLDIGSADAEQVSGNLSEIPVSSPAPAEPAEEETKAETGGERDALAMWLTGYGIPDLMAEGIATALLNDYQLKGSAFSPVVPAPTETGPWQTWQEVPDDVWFTSTSAVGSLPAHRKRGNLVDWQFRDGSVGVYDVSRIGNGKLMCRAPYVAGEEG